MQFENPLTFVRSLKGAPVSVGGNFFCGENELLSLDGAPPACHGIYSDLGVFATWDDVPENLRVTPIIPPEKLEQAANDATTLRHEISVHRPLHLKKRR